MVGKVRRRWWVPKSIASDLSGLRKRPLEQSQDRKADRHASKRSTDSVVSLRVRPMYSCRRTVDEKCHDQEQFALQAKYTAKRVETLGLILVARQIHSRKGQMKQNPFTLSEYDWWGMMPARQLRAVPLTPELVERLREVWSGQWYRMQHWGLKKQEELVDCGRQSWEYCQKCEEGQSQWNDEVDRQIEGGWSLGMR